MNKKIGFLTLMNILVMYSLLFALSAPADTAHWKNPSSPFVLKFHNGAVTSLKKSDDNFDTDYILAGHRFGDIIVRYRREGTDWLTLSTKRQAGTGALKTDWDENTQTYTATAEDAGLILILTFSLSDDILLWQMQLENHGERALEVGDVALPFPMNHDWSPKGDITYNKRVIRHSMIEGDHSYIYWIRCNTQAPYLLMTPEGGTQLEYYDHSTPNEEGRSVYTAYIHSLAQKEVIRQKKGSWRQPHTSVTIPPRQKWQAGFKFQWASGYEDIRQKLYENGLFNIYTEPGMTVPVDLSVKVALKNKFHIEDMEPEYPGKTEVAYLGENKAGLHIYRIRFKKLGENKLTVHYGDNRHMYLEFFITEPIETLIKKRARFLVDQEQIDDPDKWYDGLLSDWNMNDKILLSPDNLHDIPKGRRYMISSDDPALSRPSFLAKKNVDFPDQHEVIALDRYIDEFVWGGLQMTTDESYPYAIYGIHDWKSNRESADPGPRGNMHIWRIYDYPHIIQMYLGMYRIARYHPGIETKHTRQEYLERAYGTAVAFYLYPQEVIHWSPYKTGTYNEVAVLSLIDELEAAGWNIKADRLRMHWERKVAFFLSGKANLFGSEYPYDTTGFESTYAFARYAVKHAGRSGDQSHSPLKVSQDSAWEFMQQQTAVNIGSRGWLEKAYYLYGSDYRGSGNAKYTLSYMAQMGGWSLLDYTLHYAPDPYKYLRLAYASELSSWALMNTGTPESNYGYWYPGKVNDGGAGGGFEPLAYGYTWLQQPHGRGSWYYGCEIDLGFTGYLRSAATILADDPVFGLTAYGGVVSQEGDETKVIPRDGLRRRFHVLRHNHRFHMELSYDRFAAGKPIMVNDDLSDILFNIENADRKKAHDTRIMLSGLSGTYEIRQNGKKVATAELSEAEEKTIRMQIKSASSTVEIVKAG